MGVEWDLPWRGKPGKAPAGPRPRLTETLKKLLGKPKPKKGK